MMTRAVLALSLGLGLALVACGGASPEDEAEAATIAALTGDVGNGKTLYTATCETCHGANGRSGSENRDIVTEAKGNKESAIEQVLGGGGSMPAYRDTYTDQEIADLVAYAASL